MCIRDRDDTIQHAGVVIGFGGIAGHCFVQQKRGTTGYCHRIICAQDYSCLLYTSVEWPIPEGMELSFSDKDTKWGSFKEYRK